MASPTVVLVKRFILPANYLDFWNQSIVSYQKEKNKPDYNSIACGGGDMEVIYFLSLFVNYAL